MTLSRSLANLAFLLAAGCAPSQWEKPGGEVASRETDLLACRQGAHLSPAAGPSPIGAGRPTIAGDGLLGMQSSPEIDSARELRIFQATQDCMREKGYRLKPAPAR